MVSMPGTMSEKFLFTVRDDAVAQKINANLGKKVALSYDQHIGQCVDHNLGRLFFLS